MKPFALAVCTSLLTLPFFAVARAEDQPKVNCEGGGASTYEQEYCAEQDFEKADKKLNAVYKKALAAEAAIDKEDGLDAASGAVQSLKTAQRIWVQYRDAHCDTVGYGAHGGTMLGGLLSDCKMQMTEKRIKELQSVIRGPE
jgi:uncharacterized protein YecT (DUF1311 family)